MCGRHDDLPVLSPAPALMEVAAKIISMCERFGSPWDHRYVICPISVQLEETRDSSGTRMRGVTVLLDVFRELWDSAPESNRALLVQDIRKENDVWEVKLTVSDEQIGRMPTAREIVRINC
jgi:hypothetical protein